MSRFLLTVDARCPYLFQRCLSTTAAARQPEAQLMSSSRYLLDPENVHTPRLERKLLKEKAMVPVGSRRKRALIREGNGIPFEQQPYQCFQDARQYLVADRATKIRDIQQQRERLQRLREKQVAPQEQHQKERRILSMERNIEKLKILADINDPMIKRIFEDGKGDLNKPIYRFLADRQWRSYKKKVLDQRMTQMNLVPDLLPQVDISVDMEIYFAGRMIDPGSFVNSKVSESAPRLRLQTFKKGEQLFSIAVVTPDIPDVANDSFSTRLHFLACNIKLSPTETNVPLSAMSKASQLVHDWLPAYSQQGAPYQRLAIFVLEQSQGVTIDTTAAKESTKRDGFVLRSFVDKNRLTPVSAGLFRSQYDEDTAGVMHRLGVPGHDVQFKRKKVEPLPYKRLPTSRFR